MRCARRTAVPLPFSACERGAFLRLEKSARAIRGRAIGTKQAGRYSRARVAEAHRGISHSETRRVLSGGSQALADLSRYAAVGPVSTMLCNSSAAISRAAMTSRLSSCSCGSSSNRSSKKCIRLRRPSHVPQVTPAGSSADAVRPISSASSRRAAASGVSPRRTRHQGSATRPDTRCALVGVLDPRRPPPRLPHGADAPVATR